MNMASKKEIKEFTEDQLRLFAEIKKLTKVHSFETLDEVFHYITNNLFDFSNKQ